MRIAGIDRTDPPEPPNVLQLTKRTEYGLIALIHMADRPGQVVSVREVSEHYPIPRRLLAEVVKDLARAGLVDSQRGATGGYTLTRSADNITLGDVVVALEGAPLIASCDAHGEGGGSSCEVEPVCPIRSPLQRLREGLWRLMERTTLRSLSAAGPLVELDAPLHRPDSGLAVFARTASNGPALLHTRTDSGAGPIPTILS